MTSQNVEIGNLGPCEGRKRLIFGLVAFAGALAVITAGWIQSLMGWVLFFALMVAGSLGLFEAKRRT